MVKPTEVACTTACATGGEVPLQLAKRTTAAISGVAVAAEVEEAGATALGAHVGALRHHEVHEAGAAPGRHEHVPGAAEAAAAVVAGAGLVGGREGRERGRDGRSPAAARAAGAAAGGAAALGLVLVLVLVLVLLAVVLFLVVVVIAAVVAGGAPPRAGDVRAHGRRHGGVPGRRCGRAAGAPRRRRRGARRRRGEGRRRARVHHRSGAVLPVDVVHLPRLHEN